MKYAILYNPLAGAVNDVTFSEDIQKALPNDTFDLYDVTKIEDVKEFMSKLDKDVNVIVAGGDGTLNRFINSTDGYDAGREIYYYAAGNGNDFWADIGKVKGEAPINIKEHIADLPEVTVNDKTYKFINGVGFGIDGYCCEVGDKLKSEGKNVNYTGIAIKGLLFHFKPRNAKVTVDGETYTFKKVWIAPTMNGRMYGGGMLPTPAQDRLNKERTLSSCILYGSGKLKTLMIFPSIFKGEHVAKEKHVKILSGKEITVEFDKPCALQIDGETILNVSKYTVKSAKSK